MISKVFEKWLYKQIAIFMDPLLSKHQCGFRKGSAQHCLLAMLEKSKNAVDKGKIFGASSVKWSDPGHFLESQGKFFFVISM